MVIHEISSTKIKFCHNQSRSSVFQTYW